MQQKLYFISCLIFYSLIYLYLYSLFFTPFNVFSYDSVPSATWREDLGNNHFCYWKKTNDASKSSKDIKVPIFKMIFNIYITFKIIHRALFA